MNRLRFNRDTNMALVLKVHSKSYHTNLRSFLLAKQSQQYIGIHLDKGLTLNKRNQLEIVLI